MAYRTISSRIQWCPRQSTLARTPEETAEWRAEADGLQDALLRQDHTHQYQQGPSCVLVRYVNGLQDGRALIRTAGVRPTTGPKASPRRKRTW